MAKKKVEVLNEQDIDVKDDILSEVASIIPDKKLSEAIDGATESDLIETNVGYQEGTTEEEFPQLDLESKDEPEATSEEIAEEKEKTEDTVEETKDEAKIITPEDIANLQGDDVWEQCSKLDQEGRLDPAAKKIFKSMSRVVNSKQRNLSDERKEILRLQTEYQKMLLDKEKKENEFREQQLLNQQNADYQKQLDSIEDPYERAVFESRQETARLKREIDMLKGEVTAQKQESHMTLMRNNIKGAVDRLPNLTENQKIKIAEKALPQLLVTLMEGQSTGKSIPLDIADTVVKEMYDEFLENTSPENFDYLMENDPRYKEYKEKYKRKGIEEIINKKEGGETLKSTQKGGQIPQPPEESFDDKVLDQFEVNEQLAEALAKKFGKK